MPSSCEEWILHPKQQDAIRILEDPSTQVLGFGGARGGGKAVDVTTYVTTPYGLRPIGDLKVGDTISSYGGGPQSVVAVYDMGESRALRVTFDDGSCVVCDPRHLWTVRRTSKTSKRDIPTCGDEWARYQVMTAQSIMDGISAGRRYTTPICHPIKFTKTCRFDMRTVPPYTLGVLIGDGCLTNVSEGSNQVTVSAKGDGTEDILSGLLEDGMDCAVHDSKIVVRRLGIGRELTRLSRICLHSYDKSIPESYLYAPLHDRMQLLRGLMDTDGWSEDDGHSFYCTTSRRLADDVDFLCRMLGCKVTRTERSPVCTNSPGGPKVCRKAYTLRICPVHFNGSEMFRVRRKRDRASGYSYNGGKGISRQSRRIVSVEEAGTAVMRCIQVSDILGLYVLGDGVVTHNSHLSRCYLAARANNHPKTQHLLIRRSYPELFRTHILRMIQDFGDMFEHSGANHRFTHRTNGSVIDYAYLEDERDLGRMQGAEYQTIVIDEAQYVPWPCIDWLRTILRTTRKDIACRQLWTFNPGGPSHHELKKRFISRMFDKNEKGDGYKFLQSLVYDNPSLSKDYIQQLEQLPEPLRSAYLNGDFDALLGSYFLIDPEIWEDEFDIQESELSENLYASVDHGIQHHTVFSVHYMDGKGIIHLLWTYSASGHNATHHATEALDRCRTFLPTKGWLPKTIVYDSSMSAETKLRDGLVWSPLDDWKAVWNGTRTSWVPATKERVWSSQMFSGMLVRQGGKLPRYRVWRKYNSDFASQLSTLERDPHRPETYLKVDTEADDLADAYRYMAAYLHGLHAESDQHVRLVTKSRHLSRGNIKRDWYAL